MFTHPPGGPHGQTESGGRVLAVNAGAREPRGGVTRQGIVLTDLQSLRDCQQNFSLSLSGPSQCTKGQGRSRATRLPCSSTMYTVALQRTVCPVHGSRAGSESFRGAPPQDRPVRARARRRAAPRRSLPHCKSCALRRWPDSLWTLPREACAFSLV